MSLPFSIFSMSWSRPSGAPDQQQGGSPTVILTGEFGEAGRAPVGERTSASAQGGRDTGTEDAARH